MAFIFPASSKHVTRRTRDNYNNNSAAQYLKRKAHAQCFNAVIMDRNTNDDVWPTWLIYTSLINTPSDMQVQQVTNFVKLASCGCTDEKHHLSLAVSCYRCSCLCRAETFRLQLALQYNTLHSTTTIVWTMFLPKSHVSHGSLSETAYCTVCGFGMIAHVSWFGTAPLCPAGPQDSDGCWGCLDTFTHSTSILG